ncbi:MAG: hypothetical protein AMXMBFR84_17670 [Candidatus Hydrogenedentota bacterium]
MAKDVFDFSAYRSGRGALVPCRRCKKPIPADSTRCGHCGLHFRGHAAEFVSSFEAPRKRFGRLARMVVGFLLGALLLALLAGFAGGVL